MGAWAHYAVKEFNQLIYFKPDFEIKRGANSIVNPVTAVAMLDLIKTHNA